MIVHTMISIGELAEVPVSSCICDVLEGEEYQRTSEEEMDLSTQKEDPMQDWVGQLDLDKAIDGKVKLEYDSKSRRF